MENFIVVTFIVGAVEFVRRLEARDYFAAFTIVLAAFIGGLSGFFGVEGLTIATGIVVGISASGLVTVAKRIGA